MKVKLEYPPNIDKIRKKFNVPENTIFTYGDTLYNPNRVYINEPLMKHEEVHSKQQGDDPSKWDAWCDKYFDDPVFRLNSEVEAYRAQYRSAKSLINDRNALARYTVKLALDLSSEMYGNIMSYPEAMKKIVN